MMTLDVLPIVVDPVTDVLETVGLPPAVSSSIAAAVVFVAVFGLIWVAGRQLLVPFFDRFLTSRGVDSHARQPLLKLTRFSIIFVAITVAFGAADYGNFLTSLATIAAAATLAIGLAMQDVLKNFVAGLFIFVEQPFRIGDWIEWDGNAGIVEDISLRVSRIRTFDNELLTVPNSQLTDGVIKNPVAKEQLRMKINFGIGYDDDIDHATEIIVEEAKQHGDILADPAPSVRLIELGDSDVVLQSRVWIADPSRGDFVKTRSEYVQAVKERFDAAGIDIPYPHRVLQGDVTVGEQVSVADSEAMD